MLLMVATVRRLPIVAIHGGCSVRGAQYAQILARLLTPSCQTSRQAQIVCECQDALVAILDIQMMRLESWQ